MLRFNDWWFRLFGITLKSSPVSDDLSMVWAWYPVHIHTSGDTHLIPTYTCQWWCWVVKREGLYSGIVYHDKSFWRKYRRNEKHYQYTKNSDNKPRMYEFTI